MEPENLHSVSTVRNIGDWPTGADFPTLHSFDSTDDANPVSGLVQATNRNRYGITDDGGSDSNGTVFKIDSSGTLTVPGEAVG